MLSFREQFSGLVPFHSSFESSVCKASAEPAVRYIKNQMGTFADLVTIKGSPYVRYKELRIKILDSGEDLHHVNSRIRFVFALFSLDSCSESDLRTLLASKDGTGMSLLESLIKSYNRDFYVLFYEKLRKNSELYTLLLPTICSYLLDYGAIESLHTTLQLMINSAAKVTASQLLANIEFVTTVLASDFHDQIVSGFHFNDFLIPLLSNGLKHPKRIKIYLGLINQLIQRDRVLEVSQVLNFTGRDSGKTLLHSMPYQVDGSLCTDLIVMCQKNKSITQVLGRLMIRTDATGCHFLEEAINQKQFVFLTTALKQLFDNSILSSYAKHVLTKLTSVGHNLFQAYVQYRTEEALDFLDSLPLSSAELVAVLKVGRLTNHSALCMPGFVISPDFYDILESLEMPYLMDARTTELFFHQLFSFQLKVFNFLFRRFIKDIHEKGLFFDYMDKDVLSSYIVRMVSLDTQLALDGLEYLIKKSPLDPMTTFNKSFRSTSEISRFLLVIFEKIRFEDSLRTPLENKIFNLLKVLSYSRSSTQMVYWVVGQIFKEHPGLFLELKTQKMENLNLKICLTHFAKEDFLKFHGFMAGRLAMIHQARLFQKAAS